MDSGRYRNRNKSQSEGSFTEERIEKFVRKINPSDIKVPEGYKVEAFVSGLDTPTNMIFGDNNDVYVADSGIIDGNGKLLKLTRKGAKVIADGFNAPVTGITYHRGEIYVAHRGCITVIRVDGLKEDILWGLPSLGDHHNNRVVFGPDGKMYFGQGTATNSGVVGLDNFEWVKEYPFFHDYPGATIPLSGVNYRTRNFMSLSSCDTAFTGAFSPFGVPSQTGETIKRTIRASGSILRVNPDGSELEFYAGGLRNPFRIKFDRFNRLFAANHGMDVRGSRPIANSPDEFREILEGEWYGWPDYTGGFPVILPVFRPKGRPQPTFVMASHPMLPSRPLASFTPHSVIMGFDFNYALEFPGMGDAYIAEFGSGDPETTGGELLPHVGRRISRINMETGKITTFAINKSGYAASMTGDGGFERPIDVIFGPDRAMYVVDFGLYAQEIGENASNRYIKGTGVIWKIVRII